LVGLAIGGGAGAIIGAAAGSPSCSGQSFCLDILNRSALAAFGAVGVGAVGAIIGVSTDFTRSTVYKAP
jgi:hypothetical protein